MFGRIKRRLASDRGSVFLEYALVSCVTLGLAALLLNPDSMFFKGIGYDYSIREWLIKLPIF